MVAQTQMHQKRALKQKGRLLWTAVCGRLGANGVVVGVSIIDDRDNRRHCSIICKPAMVAQEFAGEGVRAMKGVEGTQAWLLQNVIRGGFTSHVRNIMKVLSDKSYLAEAEFLVTREAAQQMNQGELDVEGHFAHKAGLFTLTLAAAQMKRYMWLLGVALHGGRSCRDGG